MLNNMRYPTKSFLKLNNIRFQTKSMLSFFWKTLNEIDENYLDDFIIFYTTDFLSF